MLPARPPASQDATLRGSASSDDITRRLGSLRLQAFRQELNEGLLTRPAGQSSASSVHPALSWLDREVAQSQKTEEAGRTAGPPAPRSWNTAPASFTHAGTKEGRSERIRLHPSALTYSTTDPLTLVYACLRHTVWLLAQGDDAALAFVHYLPVSMKVSIMQAAAVEAPLDARSARALLLDPEEDLQEAVGNHDPEPSVAEDWETQSTNESSATDQLSELHLSFSSLTTPDLLALLFTKDHALRFPSLTTVDLSYCFGIRLVTVVPHLARLQHLTRLSIVGHESALVSKSGWLTGLAISTPHLRTFETGPGIPLHVIDHFAWDILWKRLDLFILLGFRLPFPARKQSDQPRSGRLSHNVVLVVPPPTPQEAQHALRMAIKRKGRARWLDIVV